MHETGSQPQIADLDHQPWPARHAIDIGRYVSTWRNAHGKGSVNFITGPRLPLQMQMVQSPGVWTDAPPPQSSPGGGRSGMAPANLLA